MIKINLRKLLSDRGMTQSELASRTGIRPSTICAVYNNSCAFLKLEHKRLGHSTSATTLNYYAHATSDSAMAEMERLIA